MDKGIRPFARNKFVELNELRRKGAAPYDGKKANTLFRKDVIASLMEAFGITLASAATHYNDAFRFIKEQNAELVSGLGRPEDKKGGRKKKVVAEAAPEVTREQVLTNMLAATGTVTPALQAEVEEAQQAVEQTLEAACGEAKAFEEALV